MKPYKNRPKIVKGDNGIKTDNTIATFGLPEVNVYPNNRWGDIARNQGLETARNWRNMKNYTSNNISKFGRDVGNTTYSITRLIPGKIGLVTDFIDGGLNIYNTFTRSGDFTMDLLKGITNIVSNKFSKYRKIADATEKYGADAVEVIGDTMFKIYKNGVNLSDQIQDSKQLYDEINARKP